MCADIVILKSGHTCHRNRLLLSALVYWVSAVSCSDLGCDHYSLVYVMTAGSHQ